MAVGEIQDQLALDFYSIFEARLVLPQNCGG